MPRKIRRCSGLNKGVQDSGAVGGINVPRCHEDTDDVGQLVRVAEVDRVCSPLDDHEQGVVHRLSSDLAQALAAGHEWVAVADDRQRGDAQGKQPVERRVPGQGAEEPQRARHAEPQVVRHGNLDQARRLPGAVADQLTHDPVQGWLCSPPAGARTARSIRSG
jgi:hypothetical protein